MPTGDIPQQNRRSSQTMATFTVDTKLFRELGELLVGRESTALVELIKNAYDADATMVRVHANSLDDPRRASILVTDNGIGMTAEAFRTGFLRIASRSKVINDVRSPYFRRRYTGEKGVGRLAAHKLAKLLSIKSLAWDHPRKRDDLEGFPAASGIEAFINWDAVEAAETLDQIEGRNAVGIEDLTKLGPRPTAGTTLTLSNLRRRWTDGDKAAFFEEVETLVPPPDLAEEIPASVIAFEHVLQAPYIRDQGRPGSFNLDFSGDLRVPDADSSARRASAHWLIEIDCSRAKKLLRLSVVPTVLGKKHFERAESFTLERRLDGTSIIDFQARIFQRSNRSWPRHSRGVRIYHEGFRVLPYGDPSNDWLGLERDYRSRSAQELGRLQQLQDWGLPRGSAGEGMVLQGSNAFFGAVFLTREGAADLQMLVNREGFLPNPKLDFIGEMVRLGLDLHVRLQYAATTEMRQARSEKRSGQSAAVGGDPNRPPSALAVKELQQRAVERLSEARSQLATGSIVEAKVQLDSLEDNLRSVSELTDEMASEATMYRVVASLGLEQAAFVHEVNGLALTAQSVIRALEGIAAEATAAQTRRLRPILLELRELRERLRRNAVYLTDIAGIEGRRRRSRSSIRVAAEKTIGFFKKSAEARHIIIDNQLAEDLVSPPMFPAELVAIFSNLLSNAVKFAGTDGRILIEGGRDQSKAVWINIQNTGIRVDQRSAERWFAPFQSMTEMVDARLGQGMGLGLTITRSLISEYGGTIQFVQPSRGFSTAVKVELPGR